MFYAVLLPENLYTEGNQENWRIVVLKLQEKSCLVVRHDFFFIYCTNNYLCCNSLIDFETSDQD